MKALRSAYILALPIAIAGITFVIRSSGVQRTLVSWFKSQPVLECPDTIDLGEQESGEQMIAHFSISNPGRNTLVIDNVRSTCTCSGLERLIEGKYERLDTYEVEPHAQKEFAIRMVAGGEVGGQSASTILFHTNDPERPEASIRVIVSKVKGGIVPAPRSVVFGTLPLNAAARQVVDLFDYGNTPRCVEKVLNSNPERFIVNQIDLPESEAGPNKGMAGRLVGRLEVIARTGRVGPLDGVIQVFLAGESRRPDTIDVSGRVCDCVEISPSSLILPRYSENGPLFWAKCLLKSMNDKPLHVLLVEPLPRDVSVEIPSAEERKAEKVVVIKWTPPPDDTVDERSVKLVRLRVAVGDEKRTVEVEVLCQGEDSKP